MHLTWNGHSCFTLEIRQGTLVLDPYRPGSVPGLPNLKLEADGVYCSHQHDDHAGAELVTLSGRGHTVQVEEIETYHDPEQGALRGKNTIRIFTAEGLRVAAQVRAMLPQFWGISGSTKTIFSNLDPPRVSGIIVFQMGEKFNYKMVEKLQKN